MTLTRRSLLACSASFAAAAPFAAWAEAKPAIHVMKDPNCGCCSAWIEILENEESISSFSLSGSLNFVTNLD